MLSAIVGAVLPPATLVWPAPVRTGTVGTLATALIEHPLRRLVLAAMPIAALEAVAQCLVQTLIAAGEFLEQLLHVRHLDRCRAGAKARPRSVAMTARCIL